MIKKIVISPDNKKAIDFFNLLIKRKEDLKKKIGSFQDKIHKLKTK